MVYYTAVSYLYLGIQSEESQQMGERIAYFEKSSEMLNNAAKLAKNLDNDVVSEFWLNLLYNDYFNLQLEKYLQRNCEATKHRMFCHAYWWG